MKIKCGTDIVEIERIKESIEKLGYKITESIALEVMMIVVNGEKEKAKKRGLQE